MFTNQRGKVSLSLSSFPVPSKAIAWSVSLLALLWSLPASAQEVNWRKDYAAVRKEASQANRLILIKIGTRGCLPCRRLEGTTFKDPRIVRLLQSEFVPLNIDASHDPFLPRALNVQLYPTVILAAPDGSILQYLEGFKDAETLHAQMQAVLATVRKAPSFLATYQEAIQALTTPDYPRAVRLLRQVSTQAAGHPVATEAERLLQGLEQQASVRLAQGVHLEEFGQITPAGYVFEDVVRTYPGTRAAEQAGYRLNRRGVESRPTRKDRNLAGGDR
jgi:hypothetical protein